MESLSTITVTYSIILGLGITNLLTSMIAMFRSRGHGRLHWMPLVWAVCIFSYQIQFWWAIIELDKLMVFTFAQYLLLMMVVLLLFMAAAIVLPDNELREDQNLLDEFHRDGQWALGIMSLYAISAALSNYIFWDVRIDSAGMVFLGAEFILPLINLMTRRVWLETLTTIIYALNCVASNIYLSPGSYK